MSAESQIGRVKLGLIKIKKSAGVCTPSLVPLVKAFPRAHHCKTSNAEAHADMNMITLPIHVI